MKNTRSRARELAFKLVFEDTFGTCTAREMLPSLFEEEDEAQTIFEQEAPYIEDVRVLTHTHRSELDQIIASFAKGWSVERMSRVDLSILRLALCEILYRDDVPAGAAINEAVELAKKYSSPEAPAFINGILGAYIKSV